MCCVRCRCARGWSQRPACSCLQCSAQLSNNSTLFPRPSFLGAEPGINRTVFLKEGIDYCNEAAADAGDRDPRLFAEAAVLHAELGRLKSDLEAPDTLPVRNHYLQSMEQHNAYGPIVAFGDILDDFVEHGASTVILDLAAAPTGDISGIGAGAIGYRLVFAANGGCMDIADLRNCFALGRRKADVVVVGSPHQLGEFGVGLKRAIAILGRSGLVFTGSAEQGFLCIGLLSTEQWGQARRIFTAPPVMRDG